MDAEILGSIAERALDWIHSFLTPSVPHLIQLQSYNMPRKLYFKEHLGLHNCFITEIYSWNFQNKPQAVSSDMLHLFFKREIAISSSSQGQSFRVNHTPLSRPCWSNDILSFCSWRWRVLAVSRKQLPLFLSLSLPFYSPSIFICFVLI